MGNKYTNIKSFIHGESLHQTYTSMLVKTGCLVSSKLVNLTIWNQIVMWRYSTVKKVFEFENVNNEEKQQFLAGKIYE